MIYIESHKLILLSQLRIHRPVDVIASCSTRKFGWHTFVKSTDIFGFFRRTNLIFLCHLKPARRWVLFKKIQLGLLSESCFELWTFRLTAVFDYLEVFFLFKTDEFYLWISFERPALTGILKPTESSESAKVCINLWGSDFKTEMFEGPRLNFLLKIKNLSVKELKI